MPSGAEGEVLHVWSSPASGALCDAPEERTLGGRRRGTPVDQQGPPARYRFEEDAREVGALCSGGDYANGVFIISFCLRITAIFFSSAKYSGLCFEEVVYNLNVYVHTVKS